jgi:Flp pilus assembly pilin Flp
MLAEVTHIEVAVVVGIIAFVLGVAFSTKVTDLAKGIPSDLRTALNGVEKATVANVKIAQATVVATLPQPVVKVAASAPLPPLVMKSNSAAPALAPAPAVAAAAVPVVTVEVPVVQAGLTGPTGATGLHA